MARQIEPTLQNAQALMLRAIETNDFILFLAAKVCLYNLGLMEGLFDDYQ